MTAASADLHALAADLAYASGTGIGKASTTVVRETASKVQQIAMGLAPVDTGLLSRTIVIKFPDPTTAVIHPQQPYGVYQEFGTGARGEFEGAAYQIKPKSAGGVLSFQVNGRKVVVRSVTHRGVPAHPFMRPAVAQALGPAAKELADTGALLITKGRKAL